MSNADNKPKLRVAIIGAGPAGLGAAIEFQKLPFVDLHIYEQARELREVGAGISIQRNTWRMLDALGVYDNIDRDSVFSAADGHSVQHRNGRTGELLQSSGQQDTPSRHKHARALRSVLQQALLKAVDKTKLRLSSRLVEIRELPNKALSLRFEDGHVDEVDLLIGADGVRSDFGPIIQDVLSKVGEVKKFPLFAGPRLSKVVSHGSIALIGDASHRAGAGFALEDAYVLARAVTWAHERDLPVSNALALYDKVRSPHYKDMYDILDGFGRSDTAIKDLTSFDEIVVANVQNKWTDAHDWLYHYNVQEVWKKAYEEEDARRIPRINDTKEVDVHSRL
ncbi:hypothetical protein APSETT444_010372 [Aspergillus pseudonomiae]